MPQRPHLGGRHSPTAFAVALAVRTPRQGSAFLSWPWLVSLALHATVAATAASMVRAHTARVALPASIDVQLVSIPDGPAGVTARGDAAQQPPTPTALHPAPRRADVRPERRVSRPGAARLPPPVATAIVTPARPDAPPAAPAGHRPGTPPSSAPSDAGSTGGDPPTLPAGIAIDTTSGDTGGNPGNPDAGEGGRGSDAGAQVHLDGIRSRIGRALLYPPLARRRGWQGRVIVGFTLGRDGGVRDIRVVRSSGFDVLDQSALSAVLSAAPFSAGAARTWRSRRPSSSASSELLYPLPGCAPYEVVRLQGISFLPCTVRRRVHACIPMSASRVPRRGTRARGAPPPPARVRITALLSAEREAVEVTVESTHDEPRPGHRG
jgi:protein TonB